MDPRSDSGLVALSRFVIANGMVAEVREAFRSTHLLDGVLGYRRMEVISPVERPDEIWLLTSGTTRGASAPGGLGGRIAVESDVGHGSTFSFAIPATARAR